MTRRAALETQQAKEVLHALLYNVYRAFDRRDESLVYDRLAQSITGDLLTDVYLQVRRSMELENQGGARVKVDDVEILEVDEQQESLSPALLTDVAGRPPDRWDTGDTSTAGPTCTMPRSRSNRSTESGRSPPSTCVKSSESIQRR